MIKVKSLILLFLFILSSHCSSAKLKSNESLSKEPNLKKPLSRETAQTRASQIGSIHYNLWFGLDQTHLDFQGRAVITFDLKNDTTKSYTTLDFSNAEIRSLKVNSKILSEIEIKEIYNGAEIRIKTKLLTLGQNRIEVAYSHRYSESGTGLHRSQDPEDKEVYIYSNNEPLNANEIFPCFDQPDLKATFEVTAEVPQDWEVIANTRESGISNVDGRKSWAFPMSAKMSTYLFALHAGPYSSFKDEAYGIPLRLFARKSQKKYIDFKEWFEITQHGLNFFAEKFGVDYPFIKYDQIIVPDFNSGAMENIAAVTFSERYLFRSNVTTKQRMDRANTILHELAHMWFGNLVTMRWWNGLWLNESFATVAATWALQKFDKYSKLAQIADLDFFETKTWGYWTDQLSITHPIDVSVKDTFEASSNFDGITYAKGASAIKQLMFYMGEDDFTEGLQRYFKRHAYKNATLADFIKALNEASGLNLALWQKKWLQSQGLNTLKIEFQCDGANLKSLQLNQGNTPYSQELRPHKTRLAFLKLKNGTVQTLDRLEVAYSELTTSVTNFSTLDNTQCPDMIFANDSDYDYVKLVFSNNDLSFLSKNITHFKDPLLKAMIWNVLFEMLVDSDLKADKYADMAIKALEQELDANTIEMLLDTTFSLAANRQSAFKFMPLLKRNMYLDSLEKMLWSKLKNRKLTDDTALVYFKKALEVTHSKSSIDFLNTLLIKKQNLPSVKIDQDRRWEITQTLARLSDELSTAQITALVESETKNDPSQQGISASFLARSLIRSKDNKLNWFNKITRNEPNLDTQIYKLGSLRSTISGFYPLGQEEVWEGLLETSFNSIMPLKSNETEEYLSRYTRRMLTPSCNQQSIDLATRFINSNGEAIPASSLKDIKIYRQEQERCNKARAFNL